MTVKAIKAFTVTQVFTIVPGAHVYLCKHDLLTMIYDYLNKYFLSAIPEITNAEPNTVTARAPVFVSSPVLTPSSFSDSFVSDCSGQAFL